MTNDELVSQIEYEESQSLGMYSGQLAETRRKSMAYYMGEPYGNEVEGRSQVVTSEVRDSIEGQLPALLEIFTASEEIVKFEGQNANDEAEAQQKTDYANYIFWRKNPGFTILYSALKDALTVKNCFIKVYWEDYEENTKETYEGLADVELALLMQDDEVEIKEHTQNEDGSHDVVCRRTKKDGKICIETVPPEEIRVSRDCGNFIEKARFVQHRTKKTISALREMGFDVSDEIADDSEMDWNVERVERKKPEDDGSPDDSGLGPSREVWVSESEYRVDYDGDGLAELRKVITIGKKILYNEEIDSGSIITGTPKLMPHKLFGLSTADDVMDIQLQKSTVTRQLFDNSYLANNGRYEALDGMVNMDDLLTNRPGGIVRVKTLGAVKRIDSPLLGAPAFGLLEYLDHVKDARVGVSPADFAADPNALNAKAHVAEIANSSSMQRVTLIARIMAETCIKALFEKIVELGAKHDGKTDIIKLRDKYIPVNPREWTRKFNSTVTVGLGTGSQATVQNGAMGILNIQQGMAAVGLSGRVVTETNAYAAGLEFAKTVFPRKAELFFTDPSQLPPAQPQVDPKIQLAAEKMQMQDKQKRDFKGIDVAVHQQDMQHESGMQAANFVGQAAVKGIDVASQTNLAAAQRSHDAGQTSQQQHHEARTQVTQANHEHAQNRISADDQKKQIRAQIKAEQDQADKERKVADDQKAKEEQSAKEKADIDERIKKQDEAHKESIKKLEEKLKESEDRQKELLQKMAVKKTRTVKVKRDAQGNLTGAEIEE